MKIHSIEADNFKLFTTNFHKIQDITNAEMILFNGPNGYGKTSVFDIIEFCLTGEIKRISDYSDKLAIAKNEKFENKILISDETKKAFVKLGLEDKGQKIEICYSYNPIEKKKGGSKENNPHNIFDCFTRTIVCDGKGIQNQEEFLKRLQFDDIKEIFDKCCFLSQDEHLQFLKTTKKSKVEALSFLFDVPDIWKKKQESVYEQLDILSNKKKKTCYLKKLENEREEKAGEIEGLNAAIQKCNKESNVVYQRLFTDKDIFWDKESVKFDDITYTNAKKELDNLIYFAEHKTECANFLFNIPYQNLIKDFNGDKNISYTQYPLEYSYRFIGLVKQVEVLEEKYQREKKAQLILKNIQEKQYEDLNWLFIQEEKLLEDDSITIIKQQLGVISNLRKAQGILQNAMTALGQSRENLVKNANAAMEAGGISDKQCPLCGAPYSDRDELDSKIKEETELLSDISDDSVIIIQDIRNQIYNNYLKKVEKTIQEILADVVTEEMYQSLQDAKKYGSQILEVERILEKIGVGLNRKDTAKILQQKFNGKSIYIHTSEDVEDIQFVNSPQDNQDILYSMSSGQLSAVALSFLLCMNQAYGAHKACSILLIDDPVQTIDDVNMVGLVDILRYGFGDRQIFISTHEQSFEWFLRYRYSKAGKNVKIFNMKDIMLQEE